MNTFIPNGPSGIQELSFPYTWTFLKCFRNFHFRAKLNHISWYAEFYDADHPSQALNVTIGILKQFNAEALARGKTPIITVIPDSPDLIFFRKNGRWPYQSLIDGLKNQNIEVFNFGEGIMRHLGAGDVQMLFNAGHYNEKGNRILASIVFEYLQERELLLPQKTQQKAPVSVDKQSR